MKLLTRDEFREGVFARDKHLCVICGQKAADAHHIIERRLFTDGGYYLDNGASLCPEHHLLAESTELSCDEIRPKAGITKIVIPEHFYDDLDYDKWGNIILPTGVRLRGELFDDLSVQKVIQPVLGDFSKYIKYPRAYHLPWSTLGKDDRMLKDDSNFAGKEVVATIKMDGENTTMYHDHIHARSLDSIGGKDRDYVKGMWGKIAYLLDEDMRICGENLYAFHSIEYTDLVSYFQMFSFWIGMKCLSWDETEEFAKILSLETVPVFYKGMYDKAKIQKAFSDWDVNNHAEGYVIRLADEFNYRDFRKNIAKYVKASFKQKVNESHTHWRTKRIEKNLLR